MPPPHQLRVVRTRRSLVVATRVCWRNTHTNKVYISGHFRVFRSACCARKSLSRSRLLGHFRLQFPCLAIGERPRRPQDAGERPGRRRAAATGRRRAPQTATGGESAPDGHRTPESAPDGHRTPESAPDGHRTPESAPDGHRTPESAPDGHRTPESAPDGHRTPESAPDGHRTPESAPDGHRTPESAPILSKIQPLVLDQVGGSGTPRNPPFFYLIHLGRAPARARARIMRPRARFWPLDWSHGA